MPRPPARRRRAAALIPLATAVAACGDGDGRDVTIVEVAAQPCDRPTRDFGVGVVVAPDLVATAGHTVEGPRRTITVDGAPATVLTVDSRTDIALLRADVDDGAASFADVTPTRAVVATPDREMTVDVLRTGRLVVDDTTDRRRYTRQAHTIAPGVGSGTSGAPLLDGDRRLLGIVVLANRTDDTSYAVTAAEVRALVDGVGGVGGVGGSAAPSPCPD